MAYQYKSISELTPTLSISNDDMLLISRRYNENYEQSYGVNVEVLDAYISSGVVYGMFDLRNQFLSTGEVSSNLFLAISSDEKNLEQAVCSLVSSDIVDTLIRRNFELAEDKTNKSLKLGMCKGKGTYYFPDKGLTSLTLKHISAESIAVDGISGQVILDGTGPENKIVNVDFVNSSIENSTASYITKVVSSDGLGNVVQSRPFESYGELSSTHLSDMYKDGKRCTYGSTLNKNDYCYVLSDEVNSGGPYRKEGPQTTRYRFTGLSCDISSYDYSKWTYMYHVNSSPFTDIQWKSINSGITKQDVENIKSSIVHASKDNYGIVKVGSGINVQDGCISVDTPTICSMDEYENWLTSVPCGIQDNKIYIISDDV